MLRNEIPFPEIPCTFKWHAKLPQDPLPKKQTKKKNGVHTNEKLSTIPTHIWACVDVKKTQPWPHTAEMYHEWNMRYWGITGKCRGKKEISHCKKVGKRVLKSRLSFSFIIWEPKNSTIWSQRIESYWVYFENCNYPSVCLLLTKQDFTLSNTLSLKTLSDFIESKRQW